jgi:hypothetical protein
LRRRNGGIARAASGGRGMISLGGTFCLVGLSHSTKWRVVRGEASIKTCPRTDR